MECPKCKGPVIPATKTSEKSPDFVCANELLDCLVGNRAGNLLVAVSRVLVLLAPLRGEMRVE